MVGEGALRRCQACEDLVPICSLLFPTVAYKCLEIPVVIYYSLLWLIAALCLTLLPITDIRRYKPTGIMNRVAGHTGSRR